MPGDNVMVCIGRSSPCGPGCSFLLYNSGNSLETGGNRMLSRDITVRRGEFSHMVFETESGASLNGLNAVKIGNHVWIDEHTYLTRRGSAPDGCLVGVCAVVTSRFDKPGCVIAGNPATVVRRMVKWLRNRSFLPEGSTFEKSWFEQTGKMGSD